MGKELAVLSERTPLPPSDEGLFGSSEWAVDVELSALRPPPFRLDRKVTVSIRWGELLKHYLSLQGMYSKCGALNLHEREFWTKAGDCLDPLASMSKAKRECDSMLDAFGYVNTDRPTEQLKIPPSGNIIGEGDAPEGPLKRVLFVFRGLSKPGNTRLSCVLKAFERVRDSSAYLTPIARQSCTSDQSRKKGSEGTSFGVSVKVEEGSEQLSTFLEREHDIPLFQRQKMGSSLLNSVIELVKEVGDESVVNGLTRDCVIVSNATRWRSAQEAGNDFVCPRLKVSIPWAYVAHGSRHDTAHVKSGISVLLFEIMSVNAWNKPYPPMRKWETLERVSKTGLPKKKVDKWEDVPEVELPLSFRDIIRKLEESYSFDEWMLGSLRDEWDEFNPYSFEEFIPMAFLMGNPGSARIGDAARAYSTGYSFVDRTLSCPDFPRCHPMCRFKEKFSRKDRSNTANYFSKKIMKRVGCINVLAIICMVGNQLPVIPTALSKEVCQFGHPLIYVALSTLRPTVVTPDKTVLWIHAYVESLKASIRGLHHPDGEIVPAIVPGFHSLLDCRWRFTGDELREKFSDTWKRTIRKEMLPQRE